MSKTVEKLLDALNEAQKLADQIKEQKISLELYNLFMCYFRSFDSAFKEALNTGTVKLENFSLDQRKKIHAIYGACLLIQYFYWNSKDKNIADNLESPDRQADFFEYCTDMAIEYLDNVQAENLEKLRDELILIRQLGDKYKHISEYSLVDQNSSTMTMSNIPSTTTTTLRLPNFLLQETNNPANIFARHGRYKVLEILLYSVSFEKRFKLCRKRNINGRDEDLNPLLLAAQFANLECLHLLFENGADPHAVIYKKNHPYTGYMPVMFLLKHYCFILKQENTTPEEIQEYQNAIKKLLQPQMQSAQVSIKSLETLQSFVADLPAPNDDAQKKFYAKLKNYLKNIKQSLSLETKESDTLESSSSKRPREEPETKLEERPKKRVRFADPIASTESQISGESKPPNTSQSSSSVGQLVQSGTAIKIPLNPYAKYYPR